MRFGLVLGQLATLKKNWVDYEQLLKVVFSCFQEQKNNLKFCNIFYAPEDMEKAASKVAQLGPIFFSVLPTGPKPAQISYSVP